MSIAKHLFADEHDPKARTPDAAEPARVAMPPRTIPIRVRHIRAAATVAHRGTEGEVEVAVCAIFPVLLYVWGSVVVFGGEPFP